MLKNPRQPQKNTYMKSLSLKLTEDKTRSGKRCKNIWVNNFGDDFFPLKFEENRVKEKCIKSKFSMNLTKGQKRINVTREYLHYKF